MLASFTNPWLRKSLRHSWRRWLIFEFWPAWFAYAPIVPYYIYLSVKNRSVFHPFYANPGILNGGLIGESKREILRYLAPEDPATLPAVYVEEGKTPEEIESRRHEAGLAFPLIAKPDVGQRGFAVRILKTREDLADYARKANFSFLLQTMSRFSREAGLFYIRQPGSRDGKIVSITDKRFPSVTGDGVQTLGELILADHRARILPALYLERHRTRLDEVVPKSERVLLSECGNHCQGAIFLNGEHLNSPALNARIDALAKRIPHFYFGRFDVRYEDEASLQRGENFEIVEINGAGADITHIYDDRTPVAEAYRTMFAQWRYLFEVGRKARALHGRSARVDTLAFLKECLRVNFRRSDLRVSS